MAKVHPAHAGLAGSSAQIAATRPPQGGRSTGTSCQAGCPQQKHRQNEHKKDAH